MTVVSGGVAVGVNLLMTHYGTQWFGPNVGRYVGLISGIIAGIATYAGLNALDKAVIFTGLYPKLPPPLDKSAFTDDVLKTKLKYSPDPKKWIDNGGKVGINKDGSWVYTDSAGNSVRYVNGYPDFSWYNYAVNTSSHT